MTIVITNAPSRISSSAALKSEVGAFSKIGDHACVGRNSDLGPWSTIGHFARVGNNVVFGQWASVGMCATVDNGVTLGSHEHVPSGHRRTRNGQVLKLTEYYDDWAIFQLYDDAFASGGPRGMSTEQARWEDEQRRRTLEQLRDALPAFLARRNVYRQERKSLQSFLRLTR